METGVIIGAILLIIFTILCLGIVFRGESERLKDRPEELKRQKRNLRASAFLVLVLATIWQAIYIFLSDERASPERMATLCTSILAVLILNKVLDRLNQSKP